MKNPEFRIQNSEFRKVRFPLRICLVRGWTWGRDPRRPHGQCLISPRGTAFETRVQNGRLYARRARTFALVES